MKKLFLHTLLFLLSFYSYGAVLSSIQKGSATIANGTSSISATITAVDLTRSFLIFNVRGSNSGTTNFQIGGYLSASNTVTFERLGTASNITIEYQVFEFSSGVTVQRGSQPGFAVAPLTRDIAISSVNTSESFATVTMSKNGSIYGQDDGILGNITSSTNLRLETVSTGIVAENIYWQVIEWSGASVEKVRHTLSNGSDSTGYSLTSTVDMSKTMVIGNHTVGANIAMDDIASTELMDNNTVIFTRVGLTSDFEFLVYVVEFSDNTDVIHGAGALLSAQTTRTIGVCDFFSTSTAGVIMPSNLNRAGANCHTANGNFRHGWVIPTLTSTNEITLTKGGTGTNGRFQFQILEFSASTPSGCINSGFDLPRTSKGIGLCNLTEAIVTVLPVEFIQFSAVSNGGTIEINWSTASELNNDYFILESSYDATNFEEIAVIEGNGTTHELTDYLYNDNRRLNSNLFYRLKQVDYDGTNSYSKTISLFAESNSHTSLLSQTLNRGESAILSISNSKNENIEISLFEISGKQIQTLKQYIEEGQSVIKIPINDKIQPGIYVIKAKSGNNYFTKKVVIQ